MKTLLENTLKSSMNYQQYRDLVNTRFADGKSTSNEDSQALVDYSKLNISRMKRLDKTTVLSNEIVDKIKAIDKPVNWLVLSEGWCGDAAQNLPIFNAIAELNDNINLRIILRDENLNLMDRFLTNGGRSIPKLIQIKDDVVSGTWGPRPSIATEMVKNYKKEHGILTDEFKKDLQIWYNRNKAENLLEDILDLLN